MSEIPEGLTPSDSGLLRHIAREGVGTPEVAARDVGITPVHAGRRLRELERMGYLRRYTTGTFLLTDRGRELVDVLRERDDDRS